MKKTMTVDTPRGQITIELFSDDPTVAETVKHFEKLANSGDLDGRKFHRVEHWVVQGGDPSGTGTGGGKMRSEYNKRPFVIGSVGVARGGDPALNSDCQWFITTTDANWLNGQYTNFGQVTSGMDAVKQLRVGDKMTTVRVTSAE